MTRRTAGPPPGGLVGWVLADDERTRRALSLLKPVSLVVIVIAVCGTAVAVAIGIWIWTWAGTSAAGTAVVASAAVLRRRRRVGPKRGKLDVEHLVGRAKDV